MGVFSVDVGVQYLTFKISYVRFPEQFGGCLIKIKQILSTFQGF